MKSRPFDGAEAIRRYVEWQARGEEEVTYLERIGSERVMGSDHETWDVHTTGERYWVITNPTNLYAQRLFPSADYTLSFHVGLMARVAAQEHGAAEEEHASRLAVPWRRWEQAAGALNAAHEAEDFQAVGMRCRESLIALVREVGALWMPRAGEPAPQAANFLAWSELVAGALAPGASNARVRAYLKGIAADTWQLTQWLTHKKGATGHDAGMVLDATRAALAAFTSALLRYEQGEPAECPSCGSYQLAALAPMDDGAGEPQPSACKACGWTNAGLGDAEQAI